MKLLTDVRDMAGIMGDSDLAIICGGGTLWEGLYMGCATLTYFRRGVQERIVERLSALGAVWNLGRIEQFEESRLKEVVIKVASSQDLRESMARQGRKIVDGRGTRRVLEALNGKLWHSEMDVRMEGVVAAQREDFLHMALQHFRELNPAFVPDTDWKYSYFEGIQKRTDCSLRWIVKNGEHIGFILFGIEDHRFLPRKTGAIWEARYHPGKAEAGSCDRLRSDGS